MDILPSFSSGDIDKMKKDTSQEADIEDIETEINRKLLSKAKGHRC